MLYILLAVSFLLIIINWKNIVPVYLCLSLWINVYIKCGPMSFMGLFSLFCILWISATQWKTIRKAPLNRYILFFIGYLIFSSIPVILFSTTMDTVGQLYMLRIPVFHIIILFVCAVSLNGEIWNGYIKIFWLCTVSLCLYGLFSYFTSTNYISEILSSYYTNYDIEGMNEFANRDARLGLQSRLSGTGSGPITYGILLVIWSGFLFGIKDSYKIKLSLVILLLLCLCNILLTGSRGALVSLVLSACFVYYENCKRNKKLLLILFSVVVFMTVLPLLPSWFESSNDVGGSSFDMRLLQAEEVLSIVSNSFDSLVWGRGLGFVQYYIETYGVTGDAHSFESVLLSGFAETGLYGIIFIYCGRIFVLWHIAKKMMKKTFIGIKDYRILCGLLIMHITYCVLVGDSYTQLFFCIYFLLIRYFMYKNNSFKHAAS